MQASQIPSAKFPIPFANAAGGSYIRPIPVPSQIGIVNGAASLTDGFPPLNGLPTGGGGVPPFMQDFNGLTNQITAWIRWANAGASVLWDSSFSTAIGGYPQGALVGSATTFGNFWFCTTDNNTSNPDTGGAGWIAFSYNIPSLLENGITISTFSSATGNSIPNGSFAPIQFSDSTNASFTNSGASGFTCRIAGTYLISGSAGIQTSVNTSASNDTEYSLNYNGALIAGALAKSTYYASGVGVWQGYGVAPTIVQQLVVGDRITFSGRATATGFTGANVTYASLTLTKLF